jgi:hypothetical protein
MRRRARGDALRRQPYVQFGKAREALLQRRLPDAPARILHALLDAALLPAGRDIAEVRIDQIVRRHRRKARIDDARLAAARHAIDRRLHVVVDPATGDAAQSGQTAQVRVEQHLVALRRIRDQPERARGAQLHVRELHLPPHSADHDAFFAPVELERFAPLEAQRHIGRACRYRAGFSAPCADRFRHPAVAPGKALRLQLREQAERRPALLARPPRVGLQRLTQPLNKTIELLRPILAPIRHLAAHRLAQPGLDRVPRQARPSRDLADRQAVPILHSPNFCVHRHGVHLFFLLVDSPRRLGWTPWSIFSEQNPVFLVNFQRAATAMRGIGIAIDDWRTANGHEVPESFESGIRERQKNLGHRLGTNRARANFGDDSQPLARPGGGAAKCASVPGYRAQKSPHRCRAESS